MAEVSEDNIVKFPMQQYEGYHSRRNWLEKHNIYYFDWQEDGYDIFRFNKPEHATFFRLAYHE